MGGCFLHSRLQAWFWRQNWEAVEGVWWEEGWSTAFRGKQTSVLHPFPLPPGCDSGQVIEVKAQCPPLERVIILPYRMVPAFSEIADIKHPAHCAR